MAPTTAPGDGLSCLADPAGVGSTFATSEDVRGPMASRIAPPRSLAGEAGASEIATSVALGVAADAGGVAVGAEAIAAGKLSSEMPVAMGAIGATDTAGSREPGA